MRVTHLSLKDFRNYKQADVTFDTGLNLIVGRNGQGKTNLVEAIAFCATLSSHRTHLESALIRSTAESAFVRMKIAVSDRSALLELQLNGSRANKARINQNSVPSKEFLRWFQTVLFAPEDIQIVRGEPALRRKFIDHAIFSNIPAYASMIAEYERIVRQRNSLLKSFRFKKSVIIPDQLKIWDDQLITTGSQIIFERRKMLNSLSGYLKNSYFHLVESDHSPRMSMLETIYVSRETGGQSHNVSMLDSIDHLVSVSRETIENDFRNALSVKQPEELDRGMTLIGPHRDDVILQLNHLPIKGYASHGETWSFVLAMRLAVANFLRESSAGGDPVIILDDVFAELDKKRRTHLLSAVIDFEQVIVTAAVLEDVPELADWNTIQVTSGVAVNSINQLNSINI